MVNTTILENAWNITKNVLKITGNKSSEFIQGNVPSSGMAKVILIGAGLVVIGIASKITSKLAKVGLWIVAAILILGTFMNIF